jgi:hypothetical protein
MPLLQKLNAFLRNVFASDAVDADLDREVRSQLEMMADENLRQGMPPVEAQRAARIDFGGIEQVKEQVRDERLGNWLHSVFLDARYGARQLRKNPSFAGIAILALALGIGFSAIVFSIFYNGVLHPFPYRDSDRLVSINISDVRRGERYRNANLPLDEIRQFREANHTFEDIAGTTSDETLYNHQGISEIAHGVVVTSNALEFWGVKPLIGRALTKEDGAAGAPPVVLLGYEFWKKQFQEDKSVPGKTIVFGNKTRTIGHPRRSVSGTAIRIATNQPGPERLAIVLLPGQHRGGIGADSDSDLVFPKNYFALANGVGHFGEVFRALSGICG